MTLAAEHVHVDAQDTFSLQGRGLKLNTAADMVEHMEAMAQVPHLRKIILSGNTLGVEAAEALGKALYDKSELEVLDLSDIFTGRLRSEIPPALTHILTACLHEKPHLRELNLSDNAFGPAGADPLAPFLEACPTLEYLHLNNNGLGVTGGSTIARALIKRAALHLVSGTQPTLRVLVAGRNRLENGSSELLARAFSLHANSLEVVRLPQNGIRPEGVVNLIRDGLALCHNLRWLDLQDNTLTQPGSEAVAMAITMKSWPELQVLNLADALLGANGGIAICKSMVCTPMSTLSILNLSYGEVNEKAIRELTVALNHMPALTKLELNGNQFSEDGDVAEKLRAVLSRLGKAEGVLGDLDDMEEASENEEEASEGEQGSDVEELSSAMAATKV